MPTNAGTSRILLIRLAASFWLATGVASFATAQTSDANLNKLMDFANNFSHENGVCAAYSLFVHQCLKNKNPSDPVVEQYLKLGNDFIERSISTGKIAAISDKALAARIDIAIEEMKTETENSCSNISVLFKPHAKTCKALYENGPSLLADAAKRYK